MACLKSGAVKESAELVRISPISGPGVCGAEFPLKVAALGESSGTFGFLDDDPRPPGSIGNQPRWPVSPAAATSGLVLSEQCHAPARLRGAVRRPGLAERAWRGAGEDEIDLPPGGLARSAGAISRGPYLNAPAYPPRDRAAAAYLDRSAAAPISRSHCRGSGRRRAIPSRRSGRWR